MCYVLCAKCYVLCALCYVLCAMCYVLEDNLAPKVGELLSILHNTAKLLYVRSCDIFDVRFWISDSFQMFDFRFRFKFKGVDTSA